MDPKSLSADFRDFLRCLNDHGVEYLLRDGLRVNVIALADLKKTKKASGRNKDLADLDNLP
jgi:hypothetical protein